MLEWLVLVDNCACESDTPFDIYMPDACYINASDERVENWFLMTSPMYANSKSIGMAFEQ